MDPGQKRTSQRAELLAAFEGLRYFVELDRLNYGWKNNSLRTKSNTRPANLDLFLKLDEELTAEENKQNVKIGFWHVRREYNKIADGLAKKAALLGDF
ncbi:MAG: hypothetical protein Q9173_005563 [Seirophora scorigena]